jgi:hypothetical protein
VANLPVIMTTSDGSTQGTRKARQRYPEQERQALTERMVEQRIRDHSSWEQVAADNEVSLRTAERWRKSDEWRQIESRWRRIMREEARTEIGELMPDAIAILKELMLDPETPPFTRMHCAKTLLEFGGVADETDEITVDHNAEFLDYLKHLDPSRSVAARVRDIEPLPSGLLPPQLQELATERPREPLLDRPDMPPLRGPASRAPKTHDPTA